MKPTIRLLVVAHLLLVTRTVCAQGLALSAVGPVNTSMGGAATACPIDASGAIMWNPATISGLARSEVSFGVALVLPTSQIASRLPAGSLGGGFPPVTLAGSDSSEAGASAIPNIGYVEHVEDTPWSVGLGVFGIGGFRANYPASTTNPILTPQPPGGVGVGRIFSEAEFLQIIPTISYALSDRLSIGFAPTATLAKITTATLLFASPDDANRDGFRTYPAGQGNRLTWGAGFQLGVYYIADNNWRFGAAIKSPQWFEPFRFRTENEVGVPRTEKSKFTYPLIVSLGTAYSGFEHWLIAVDARLFDYGNAAGFRETGFKADGALAGLGWSSIFATSVGIQYEASESLFLRVGYSFNQNPISNADSGFNVASPLVVQHFVYVGGSIRLSLSSQFSVAYVHGFENSVAGPIQSPLGAIPGSSVTSTASLDALSAGITVQF